MSKTVSIAARVDATLDAQLAQLALSTGRSKSALVSEALRSFIVTETQFVEAVEAGLADLAAGRTVDHETVMKAMQRIVHPQS